MPSPVLASHFLAGSLISLLMPVGLLIALAAWYLIAVRRVPDEDKQRDDSRPE